MCIWFCKVTVYVARLGLIKISKTVFVMNLNERIFIMLLRFILLSLVLIAKAEAMSMTITRVSL